MTEIMCRITSEMEHKKITQRELTRRLGIGETNFHSWKIGKSKSYREKLPQIAEILGVTVDYLANGVKTENDTFLSLYAKAPEDIQQAVLTILRRCQVK